MHKTILIASLFFAACEFNGNGVPYEDDDVGTDGAVPDGTGADAVTADGPTSCPSDQVLTDGHGCQPPPAIACMGNQNSSDGALIVMRITGYLSGGLLDPAPSGAQAVSLMYGSIYDGSTVMSTCDNAERWIVPYPAPDCIGKSQVDLTGLVEPIDVTLKPSLNMGSMNLAVVYSDGTVRWGDLKTGDGDPAGFTVSGAATSTHDCVLQAQSDGGSITTVPH